MQCLLSTSWQVRVLVKTKILKCSRDAIMSGAWKLARVMLMVMEIKAKQISRADILCPSSMAQCPEDIMDSTPAPMEPINNKGPNKEGITATED